MSIVKENISFQRNNSIGAIKSTLFGFRVGQIVAQIGQRELTSIFVIEHIVDSQLPEIEITLMGLGYVYTEHYLNSADYRKDFPEKWFEYSSTSQSLIDKKNIRAITEEEIELIRKSIEKEPQKWEDKKKEFEYRTQGKKILFENFKRGLSAGGIKDKLFGFRPGQLITDSSPNMKKPFIEVYIFIKNSYNTESGTIISASYIGAISHSNGIPNNFLIRHKKQFGTISLWEESKRGLTKEEMVLVREVIKGNTDFLNQIKKETGISPSLI